jgi:hypothetical protein
MKKGTSTQLAAALVAALALAACPGTDPEGTASATVYAAGAVVPGGAGFGTPTVWEDGRVLGQIQADGDFTSVCVSNGIVHAVGAVSGQTGAGRPYYWKSPDAAGTFLPGSGAGAAEAVCVSGGSVYVAGWDQEGGKVWKDGALWFSIPLAGGSISFQYAIAVDAAGDVYTAGEDAYGACIWKNGDLLDSIDDDEAGWPYFNAVGVSNGVVYAAGTCDDRPIWMKAGGVWNYLGNGCEGDATSLHLPGDGNLYVAFTDYDALGGRVWKGPAGGATLTQAVSVGGAEFGSVFVLGGNVYTGGAAISSSGFRGSVWKNSAMVSDFGIDSFVAGIFAVPQ